MKQALFIAALLLLPIAAHGQTPSSAVVVQTCGTPPNTYVPNQTTSMTMDTGGKLCDSGGGGGGGSVIPAPTTSGGLSIKRLQVANNTTSVAIDASAGQLYGIEAFNNSSVIAYVKLYNAAQGSTTCGSGTPVYQGMIPAASSGGAGYVSMNGYGAPFSTAITACITTGFADNDTTAPAASAYVLNVFYK